MKVNEYNYIRYRKEIKTMTVRELINILLMYDADEKIQILDTENKEFKVDSFGIDPSLPYIVIKERG